MELIWRLFQFEELLSYIYNSQYVRHRLLKYVYR